MPGVAFPNFWLQSVLRAVSVVSKNTPKDHMSALCNAIKQENCKISQDQQLT